MVENKNCPCTHQGCPRHGDCVACKRNHSTGSTFCEKQKINKDK